jgi:MFS family permease
MAVAACYVYTIFFFHSWFHTWLIKARGFGERDLLLSSLPFLVAAAGNLLGGFFSNSAVRQVGLQWGRRGIGLAGLTVAGLCIVAVMFTPGRTASLVLLSLAFGAITFQQPSLFALCLDIGGDYAGAVVGAMNTAAQVGALASSLTFGFLVDRYADYNLPFIPMAALLFAGALLWLKTDPLRPLVPAEP